MRIESTNLVIVSSKNLGFVKIYEKKIGDGGLIQREHLEEVRDLLNSVIEVQEEQKEEIEEEKEENIKTTNPFGEDYDPIKHLNKIMEYTFKK